MVANTGQTGPDDLWLEKLKEKVLEPELPIVDSHHHLWRRKDYTYLLPEFADDMACGHKIVASVFAECHSMYRKDGPEELRSLGETEFVRGQAAMSASGGFGLARACDVMFGNVDLTRGSGVEEILEQHVAASGGRFRGVRISSGWHEDKKVGNVAPMANLLVDQKVLDAARVVERLGMSLDCWLYHTQLKEVSKLADRCPDLTIILNHVGSPILGGPYRGRVDEVFKAWRTSIEELSKRENVLIKLGAMPIRMPDFSGDRSLPPGSIEVAAAWSPWVESCIEAFGSSRSMYESNFPVQKRWCSYQVCWNAFKRISMGASMEEKRDLFAGTAVRAYRIEGVF